MPMETKLKSMLSAFENKKLRVLVTKDYVGSALFKYQNKLIHA